MSLSLNIINVEDNLSPNPINANSNNIMSWANSTDNRLTNVEKFGNIKETNIVINGGSGNLNKMYLYRIGNLVYLTTLSWVYMENTHPTVIGTIPVGFRPPSTLGDESIVSKASVAINSNNDVGWYFTSLYKNGDIHVNTNAGIAFEYRDNLFYWTDDPMPTQLESDKKKKQLEN